MGFGLYINFCDHIQCYFKSFAMYLDLYTPNEWLSKKIADLCFNAIINKKPVRQIRSAVQVPNTSKLGKITKRPTKAKTIMRRKQYVRQHQDALVSSTTT